MGWAASALMGSQRQGAHPLRAQGSPGPREDSHQPYRCASVLVTLAAKKGLRGQGCQPGLQAVARSVPRPCWAPAPARRRRRPANWEAWRPQRPGSELEAPILPVLNPHAGWVLVLAP